MKLSDRKKKKSLVGWVECAWDIEFDFSQSRIYFPNTYIKKKDTVNPRISSKVRITIEEI